MTRPELIHEYGLSALPYRESGGHIPAIALTLKSWRYFLELNTACNVRCTLCAAGNQSGYEHFNGNGLMDMELLEKILDKMKSENPNAIVLPYGNSEPMLHPKLPECLVAIKRRGFTVELATNLNLLKRVDEVFDSKPDLIIVSVSGFTQEIYGKNHRGGDIERVKENLKLLKEAWDKTGRKCRISVSYHKYNDNQHEIEPMKQFVEKLGFGFFTSWARVISIENTVQSLRELEADSVSPYAISDNGFDLNTAFPPSNPEFFKNMERLQFHPKKARQFYERFPVSKVCIMADVFTYIRHDGKVMLCACCNDRRLTLGNYLDMDQEQLSEARRGNPLCAECLKYRLNLYFHICDCDKWDGIRERFNT